MYGYVYKIVNSINGKVYIGQHKCDGLYRDYYFGSGVNLKRAIQKYGKDNYNYKQFVNRCNNIDKEDFYSYLQEHKKTATAYHFHISIGKWEEALYIINHK